MGRAVPLPKPQPLHETQRVPVWTAQTLLGSGALALIEHEGQIYRLQRTRLGKLILTK